MTTQYPHFSPNLDAIPAFIRQLGSFTCYKLVPQEGKKPAKVPYDPRTGRLAKVNDPSTWRSFDEAAEGVRSGQYAGLNFVPCSDTFGADIDYGLDPDTGEPAFPRADDVARIVEAFRQAGAYIERSPSKIGWRIVGLGKPNRYGKATDWPQLEIYGEGSPHFLSLTGFAVSGGEALVDCQAVLNEVIAPYFEKRTQERPPVRTEPEGDELDDDVLLDKARRAKNGEKFAALYDRGDLTAHTGDASAADMALLMHLAFWTGCRPEQMDRLFRGSKLMRGKWDRPTKGSCTYGEISVKKAIDNCEQIYTPPVNPDASVDELNSEGLVLVRNQSDVFIAVPKSDGGYGFLGLPAARLWYADRAITVTDRRHSRKVNPVDLWINSPKRKTAEGVEFFPTAPSTPVIDIGHLNLWNGFAVTPQKGNCGLFWDHLRTVICNDREETYLYVRRWLAHMVQRPQELPGVALALRGGEGVGKSGFVDTVGGLLGRHYGTVTSMERLLGRFNGHWMDKLLIHAAEATWGGDKAHAGVLKSLITDPRQAVELKGRESFEVGNFVRMIISSNNQWLIPRGLDDRRFLVLDVPSKRQKDFDYFDRLHKQMRQGGLQALMHDLMVENLTGFNVRSLPDHKAGADLKVRSGEPALQWLHEVLQTADLWEEELAGGLGSVEKERSELLGKAVEWCRTRHLRPPGAAELGRLLTQALPSMSSTQPRSLQGRRRCYQIPPLRQCRQEFDTYLGGGVQWLD